MLYVTSEQSMLSAVPEQGPVLAHRDSHLHLPFRVQFDYLYFVSRGECQKREVMIFLHVVVRGDVPFILDEFYVDDMVGIGFFGFQSCKDSIAA